MPTLSPSKPAIATCPHGQTEAEVDSRFERMAEIINRAPEDDHAAQWSVIGSCRCCTGPLKLTLQAQANPFTAPDADFDCSRCVGGAK
jgi:hypothetical protein